MTIATLAQARSDTSVRRRWSFGRAGRPEPVRVSRAELPPLSPRLQLVRATLMVVFAISITLLAQLTFVGRFQHASAQQRLYDEFREQLAIGTAPIGPADADGVELPLGTPVAYLEIPSIGVSEVVAEGTTSGVMLDGPGHRRDTMLPGQAGTSVVFGRRGAFGGPFSAISELQPGDSIRVTTGQGTFEYAVLGVRPEGAPVPLPVAAGGSRLVLVTADGGAFMPSGVLRVDADLTGDAVGGPARALPSAAALPAEEGIMAGDPSTLWALALWLIALGSALGVAVAWAWYRWGRAQAWVVGAPVLLLVGLSVSGEAARLLPNLL